MFLPAGRRLGLADGALDAVGDEVHGRTGSRPAFGDLVRHHERRAPGVVAAPAAYLVEGAASREHGAQAGRELPKVPGARLGHAEGHWLGAAPGDLDVARPEVPVEDARRVAVGIGDKPVE